MGVKISTLCEDSKKIITFGNLVGKRVAMDAFLLLYQLLSSIRGVDGTPLKDHSGRVTSHLSGLFYRTINLLEKDIKPIFVFDGPPNVLKMAEIERRRAAKHKATKQMHEAQDLGQKAEAKKFAQATSRLTGEMIEESKVFIQAMGFPVVQAKQDGEAQAAYMVNQGHAWAVGTQDYDALLFGGPRIVRNLSANRTKKVKSTTVKVNLEYLSLQKVLASHEISHAQLVDIGILTGLDFYPGVEGVGAKTALKLITEHGSIDRMLDQAISVRKKPLSESLDLDLVNQVRSIFLTPTVSTDIPRLKWSRADPDKIREILIENHNFDPTRVNNAITRLMKKNASSTQRTIDSFFKRS